MNETLTSNPIPNDLLPNNELPLHWVSNDPYYGLSDSARKIIELVSYRDSKIAELLEQGTPAEYIEKAVLLFDQNSMSPYVNQVKDETVLLGHKQYSKQTHAQVVDVVINNYLALNAEMRNRNIELAQYAAEFRDNALFASRERGFPLSEEQILSRLESVSIGFASPTRMLRGDGGTINVQNNEIRIRIGSSAEKMKQFLFHEMTHALAGSHTAGYDDGSYEVTQSGLVFINHDTVTKSRPVRQNYQSNESVTDALSLKLLNIRDTDFYFVNDHDDVLVSEMIDIKTGLYLKAKYATVLFQGTGVYLSTMLNAYLKSDNDPYEDDKLAKTHAMRKYYRELRENAGQDAIKRARNIDNLFIEGKPKAAIRTAKKGRRINKSLANPNKRKGQTNIEKINAYERNRQLGIAAVKELQNQQSDRRHLVQKLGNHGVRGRQTISNNP